MCFPTANLNIVIKYDYETKDGHWIVKDYKDNYKMDRAQFKFSNLFGGNKQLGESKTHTLIDHDYLRFKTIDVIKI